MSIMTGAKAFLKLLGTKKSTIFIIAGSVGAVAATVMAVKNSKKAEARIEKATEKKAEELGVEPEDVNLSTVEKVKAAAPAYIPTALVLGASISLIMCAHKIDLNNTAAMMAAYTAASEASKVFEDKTLEVAGEKVFDKIQTAAVETRADEKALKLTQEDVYTLPGNGSHLCYLDWDGTFFRSTSVDFIEAKCTEFAQYINDNSYASLNDFRRLIGLDSTVGGEALGWNASNMRDRGDKFEPYIHSIIVHEPFHEECVCLTFNADPETDYFRTA